MRVTYHHCDVTCPCGGKGKVVFHDIIDKTLDGVLVEEREYIVFCEDCHVMNLRVVPFNEINKKMITHYELIDDVIREWRKKPSPFRKQKVEE